MKSELTEVILFAIDQASRTGKQYSQREFDRAGLGVTVDQWVLLKIIEENRTLSQSELAEKSLRDPASITRTLDILQKKSLVTREPIPENRRQYDVQLTEEGNDFVLENMKMVEAHRAQSIEGFSEEELITLKSFLLRIQQNLA